MTDKTKIIAQQNDIFRQNFASIIKPDDEIQGKYVTTLGISELPMLEQFAIAMKVRNFTDFPKGDNPYEERDAGSFKHNAETIFWKIDYYDLDYQYGSHDPSDLTQTRRVLTILFAHEY